MDNEWIKIAFDSIQPDEDVRVKLLHDILQKEASEAEKQPFTRTRLVCAVVVCVIVLVGCAAYVLSLDNYKLVELNYKDSRFEKGVGISLQGPVDSVCNIAYEEFHAFIEEYDPDGEIRKTFDDIHNIPGIQSPYSEYGCFTQDIVDKLDEIAQKYDLTLLGDAEVFNEYEELFEDVGIDSVFNKNILFNTDHNWSYHRQEGTFKISAWGKLLGNEPQWPYRFQFFYMRNMKNSFHNAEFLPIGEINDYELWEYTTNSGQELLLAVSDDFALLITETEESYITIQLINDIHGTVPYGTLEVNEAAPEKFDKAAIEAIAEIFDFTKIP